MWAGCNWKPDEIKKKIDCKKMQSIILLKNKYIWVDSGRITSILQRTRLNSYNSRIIILFTFLTMLNCLQFTWEYIQLRKTDGLDWLFLSDQSRFALKIHPIMKNRKIGLTIFKWVKADFHREYIQLRTIEQMDSLFWQDWPRTSNTTYKKVNPS